MALPPRRLDQLVGPAADSGTESEASAVRAKIVNSIATGGRESELEEQRNTTRRPAVATATVNVRGKGATGLPARARILRLT